MQLNKLKIHFFNVPAGASRQYSNTDLGEFDEIQVTYELVQGWRDNNPTTLATYNPNTEQWLITPEFTQPSEPNAFSDYLINSPEAPS